MTKAELIEKMARDAGISKAAAGAALNSFMDGVTISLKIVRKRINKKKWKVIFLGFAKNHISYRSCFKNNSLLLLSDSLKNPIKKRKTIFKYGKSDAIFAI